MPIFGTPFAGINLDRKITKEEAVRALRFVTAAEFEAIQLYQQLRDSYDDPLFKKVMDSIADEEKAHAGEFMHLLSILQPEEQVFYTRGIEEVNNLSEHKHIA